MTAERKLLILGLLRMTDMHGYVLNAHIGSMSPVTLKKPTAYNLLDRMEQDGWIEHRGEATGDRQRKVFSVTAAGDDTFFKLLREQLETFVPNESQSLVGLSFLDALPAEEACELLRERRQSIVEFRESIAPDVEVSNVDPHSGSMQLPIDYARRLADLDLTFLDDIIENLKTKADASEGGPE